METPDGAQESSAQASIAAHNRCGLTERIASLSESRRQVLTCGWDRYASPNAIELAIYKVDSR
jgi:hypothetical protein